MAHMGAVFVKVSVDGGFSLLDIASIRRWVSNDERSKAGNADLDALGHICMFHGTDNQRHLANWILVMEMPRRAAQVGGRGFS
jgi:hypothetical protein